MVVTNSEYRHAFKPKYDIYGPIHRANVDFRMVKRKAESSHDRNPFEWYTDNEEGNDESLGRPVSTPIHKYKHMLYNQAYKRRFDKPTEQMKHGSDTKLDGEDENLETAQDNLEVGVDPAPCSDVDGSQPVAVEQTELDLADEAVEDSTTNNLGKKSQPVRPKKTANKKSVPKPRSSSAPPRKGRSPVTPSEPGKAPFVAYGCEDKERETCVKMTHNVKASSQVYPMALKAYIRRQHELEARNKKKSTLSARVPKRNYYDEKITKDTSAWETEYRQHFAAHDEKVYRASLSARIFPRSATA